MADGPDYVIRDASLHRTVHHPAGWSDAADLEIRSGGKIYALGEGGEHAPVYEFREIMLYRTASHPDYDIFD